MAPTKLAMPNQTAVMNLREPCTSEVSAEGVFFRGLTGGRPDEELRPWGRVADVERGRVFAEDGEAI